MPIQEVRRVIDVVIMEFVITVVIVSLKSNSIIRVVAEDMVPVKVMVVVRPTVILLMLTIVVIVIVAIIALASLV